MAKNLFPRSIDRFVPLAVFLVVLASVRAAGLYPLIFGISTEFIFFAMLVGGIALIHGKAFPVTAAGLLDATRLARDACLSRHLRPYPIMGWETNIA